VIVYRTVNPEQLIGTPVTPRLAEKSNEQESGTLDDVNRDGTAVRTVFHRSSLSDWTVAVGVPRRVLYAAQYRSMRQVLIIGTAFLALSAAVALVVYAGFVALRLIAASFNALVRLAYGSGA
jgi:hypothetical protein